MILSQRMRQMLWAHCMCFLAARDVPGVEAVVVTTTDKVYENDSSGVAFREQDRAWRQGPIQRFKSLC